ncbi:MAG: hypothetical protein EA407_13130 [Rhodobacteraceae bacterium]|nr:MAG: hypothetical protein EA407_13130 [Paracoccaceae bacterium]
MQQALGPEPGNFIGARRESLLARQARVGIIANTKELDLPVHAPREIWTRWPDLRSARRRKGAEQDDPDAGHDPILSGDALRAFVDELREPEDGQAPPESDSAPDCISALQTEPPELPPLGHKLRPLIRTVLGLLMISLVLIVALVVR